jgi:hypothetical protein
MRNNFVYLVPGLMSASRTASSDGSLIAWNSPGTQIDHNTVLLNSNEFFVVEFRFPTTTNGTARNNLGDAPIHLRDNATATLASNLLSAVPGMFVNPAGADLHLRASATNAIDQGLTLSSVTNDIDGDRRPRGARSDIGADEFTTNAPPPLMGFRFLGSGFLITFGTFLGESYDVLRANELTNAIWSLVQANVPGTGGALQVTDANIVGSPEWFYRVRLSP